MGGNHAEGHVVKTHPFINEVCGLSPMWNGANTGKMVKESVGDCGWLMLQGGSRCYMELAGSGRSAGA